MDMWSEATRDFEREASERQLAEARIAVSEMWPFLAAAKSETDFANRLALISDRLAEAAPDPDLRKRLEASLTDDFKVMAENEDASNKSKHTAAHTWERVPVSELRVGDVWRHVNDSPSPFQVVDDPSGIMEGPLGTTVRDIRDYQFGDFSGIVLDNGNYDDVLSPDLIVERAVTASKTAASPDWLRERNNDPYGTPPNHEFWNSVDFEDIGDMRVFERDGKGYLYHRRQNYWMHFPSLADAREHAETADQGLDMWAKRKTAASTLDHGYRDFFPDQLIAQIGRMNILAVSGGRIERHANGIRLPVAYGYAVDVFLEADDTYTVQTTFTRSGNTSVKHEWTGVYADEVGETVYQASLYRDLKNSSKTAGQGGITGGEVGDRVYYVDMANPMRYGWIVEVSDDPWSTFKIEWDNGEVITTDGRQYGWGFVTTGPTEDDPSTYQKVRRGGGADKNSSKTAINALDTCNACDAPIEHPNPMGYCDEHLREIGATEFLASKTAIDRTPPGPGWDSLKEGDRIRIGYEEFAEDVTFLGLQPNSNPDFYGETPAVRYRDDRGYEGVYIPHGGESPRPARSASKTANVEEILEQGRLRMKERPDLIKGAEDAYNRQDQEWFNSLSTDDLVFLNEVNPMGMNASWDDEVMEALFARGHFGSKTADYGGPSYRGDPRWITVRYPANCYKCGRDIKKGDRAFYYPKGKNLYCDGAACGQAADRDFQDMAAVEDGGLYGPGYVSFGSIRHATAKRVMESGVSEPLPDGTLLDYKTAKTLLAVYDRLSPRKQAKFDLPPLDKLIELGE